MLCSSLLVPRHFKNVAGFARWVAGNNGFSWSANTVVRSTRLCQPMRGLLAVIVTCPPLSKYYVCSYASAIAVLDDFHEALPQVAQLSAAEQAIRIDALERKYSPLHLSTAS